jgi:hypothetical protein
LTVNVYREAYDPLGEQIIFAWPRHQLSPSRRLTGEFDTTY